jgi:site-specific DNA-cytosine methylase
MARTFRIVDLFAGPGGLGEGFTAFRDAQGQRPFKIAVSVEKETSAFETLRLRGFLRQFSDRFPKEYYDFLNRKIEEPNWEELYPTEWRSACEEVLQLELGTRGSRKTLAPWISNIRRNNPKGAILIGGPPCQAYSKVGRARNRGVKGYEARDDHRHFLYREYIDVIGRLKPAVFVMENVEGMLSSSIDGRKIFDKVLDDLRKAGGKPNSYVLFSIARGRGGSMNLVPPANSRSFLVRSEEFGVPQARHRVIILGVRKDIAKSHASAVTIAKPAAVAESKAETVRNVLQGIEKRGNMRLVIIDPVSSYLGRGIDSHKNSEVRSVLEPLGEMASRKGVAVICNNHFSKGGGTANSRIIGSVAFVNQARSAFIVTKDKENEGRLLLIPSKTNIAPLKFGLAYRIEGLTVTEGSTDIETSRINWEDSPVTITADEATAPRGIGYESKSGKAEAMEFLKEILAGGSRPASEVKAHAHEAGITDKMLRTAREALGLDVTKGGMSEGWIWALPKVPT